MVVSFSRPLQVFLCLLQDRLIPRGHTNGLVLCPAFNAEPSLEFWRMNRCRHSSVRAAIERTYKAWVYKRSSEETPTSTPRYISSFFLKMKTGFGIEFLMKTN